MVEVTCYQAECIGEPDPAGEIEELAWFASTDRERTTATGKLVLDWLKAEDLID